jgi:hypothetical protein
VKVFHCNNCQQIIFFENNQCVNCGSKLAFVPDLGAMVALEPAGDGLWRLPKKGSGRAAGKPRLRLCDNDTQHDICNWALSAEDPNHLCRSCRLTQLIPDLSVPGNVMAWARLEAAKRRMLYTLMQLQLPIQGREHNPEHGLTYELRADTPDAPALTGHAHGVITLNIAEADDAERERRRLALREPYRTLLGHFRHEVGHYYWERLIAEQPRIAQFRELFGDEREDYDAALKRHYDQGAPADWRQRFISSYATAHPWEDWAESWAHYLHMTDMLETAAASGLALQPSRRDEPSLKRAYGAANEPFDRLIESWVALTYIANNLNRSMGLTDAYPFVLSPSATAKLRFVHGVIAEASKGSDQAAA